MLLLAGLFVGVMWYFEVGSRAPEPSGLGLKWCRHQLWTPTPSSCVAAGLHAKCRIFFHCRHHLPSAATCWKTTARGFDQNHVWKFFVFLLVSKSAEFLLCLHFTCGSSADHARAQFKEPFPTCIRVSIPIPRTSPPPPLLLYELVIFWVFIVHG
ncbi:unnamed protein product [Ectocarpus sp. 4 AP-2014]